MSKLHYTHVRGEERRGKERRGEERRGSARGLQAGRQAGGRAGGRQDASGAQRGLPARESTSRSVTAFAIAPPAPRCLQPANCCCCCCLSCCVVFLILCYVIWWDVMWCDVCVCVCVCVCCSSLQAPSRLRRRSRRRWPLLSHTARHPLTSPLLCSARSSLCTAQLCSALRSTRSDDARRHALPATSRMSARRVTPELLKPSASRSRRVEYVRSRAEPKAKAKAKANNDSNGHAIRFDACQHR